MQQIESPSMLPKLLFACCLNEAEIWQALCRLSLIACTALFCLLQMILKFYQRGSNWRLEVAKDKHAEHVRSCAHLYGGWRPFSKTKCLDLRSYKYLEERMDRVFDCVYDAGIHIRNGQNRQGNSVMWSTKDIRKPSYLPTLFWTYGCFGQTRFREN